MSCFDTTSREHTGFGPRRIGARAASRSLRVSLGVLVALTASIVVSAVVLHFDFAAAAPQPPASLFASSMLKVVGGAGRG